MSEWSAEDVKTLKTLKTSLRKGVLTEVARLLGRSVPDVAKKLKELGADHAGRTDSKAGNGAC
jgi:hypothetical protein